MHRPEVVPPNAIAKDLGACFAQATEVNDKEADGGKDREGAHEGQKGRERICQPHQGQACTHAPNEKERHAFCFVFIHVTIDVYYK